MLCATILCCTLAYSQEVEVSIVPRVELNPYYDDPDFDADLGLTSLYTNIDGSFGENFTFSVSNHWLSSAPGDLYKGTPYSHQFDWLDWAYVSYERDLFGLTLGKVIFNSGGFEFEEYDVDCFYPLTSISWNEYNVYQWGATLAFTPWEDQDFQIQMVTSPYGNKYFDGNYAYSAAWRGVLGPLSTYWAYNAAKASIFGPSEWINRIGLGNRLDFDKFALTLDAYFAPGSNYDCAEAYLKGDFDITEKMDAQVMVGMRNLGDFSLPTAGFKLAYYPLKDSKDLRIHAAAAFCGPYEEGVSLSLGATYNIRLNIGK